MKREYVITVQGALAAAGAFLSAKLGFLYPVLCVLMGTMVLDYSKGQILRSTSNTAPLTCGACNTQPEGLLTMA